MSEDIYAIAAALAGGGDETVLRAMCAAAEAELRASLRPGLTAQDCRDSFVCAAALLAVSGLCGGATAGISSFSVGGVSVTTGNEARRAGDLRLQARLLMRPFSRGAFSFVGVRG